MKEKAFFRQRPLVALALAWGAGACIALVWKGAFAWGNIAGLIIASLLLLYTALTKDRKRLLWALVWVFFFGAVLWTARSAYPVLPLQGEYSIEAIASGPVEYNESDGKTRLALKNIKLTDAHGIVTQVKGAYWSFYSPKENPELWDGQALRFVGKVYHPSPQRNPEGFDFRLFLLQKNIPIGISGSKKLEKIAPLLQAPASPWMLVRENIAQKLDLYLKEDSPLAKALLIGERSNLDEETWDLFRNAGAAHVLAVSGLHISLICLMISWALNKLRFSMLWQTLIISVFLLLYCRLLDFSPSVLRATVLMLVYLLCRLLFRRPDPLTSLALSFLIILFLKPLDITNIGFQLSFLSVLGIFTLGDMLNHRLDILSQKQKYLLIKPLNKTLKAYAVTFSASAFTALPSIAVFHRLSLSGLLAGPLICAAVGVLMGTYIVLLGCVYLFPFLAQFIAPLAVLLGRSYLKGIEWVSQIPNMVMILPKSSNYAILAFILALLLCTRYFRIKAKLKLALCLVLILPLGSENLIRPQEAVRYIQFSVGSADAALFEDGVTTFGIDAGENGKDLAQYLLCRGRKLNKLFITHLHMDHIGGLSDLLRSGVKIDELVLPVGVKEAKLTDESLEVLESAEDLGIPIRYVKKGDEFDSARLHGQVLYPEAPGAYPGMNPNVGSLCIRWDTEGVSLLSTGDLSGEYGFYGSSPANVLKVAHHGSNIDNPKDLLGWIQPQLALISSAENYEQRYHQTQEELIKIGSSVYNTAQGGALSLSFQEGNVRISSFLGKE